MCQDEFEMILTEQVKRALAKKEAGLEDRVMAVVIQRLVGPKDQRTRFIANDLGHMPPSGPEVLVLFSTREAREKAQGLPVLLWFGQDETEDYHLLKIDTNFKRVEQSQVSKGLPFVPIPWVLGDVHQFLCDDRKNERSCLVVGCCSVVPSKDLRVEPLESLPRLLRMLCTAGISLC